MFSHLSSRRATGQIGTFGLGFKSVLGVSDAPEFFSRSGSFRFDGDCSRERVRAVVPGAERCPVLRLPEPIDPAERREQDDVLRRFTDWAANIVRLPLRIGARDDLRQQMIDFPPEFLLFVAHVGKLTLTDGSPELHRVLELEWDDDEYLLADGDTLNRWRLFERTHVLSGDACADRRPGDDRNDVPIWWAVPLDRLDRPGKFWAFFPTQTVSLVAGILNAPWKTNEDRQNLRPDPYTDELINAAACMIAEELPRLATDDDPARHLDALPRRHESGDTDQADLLRKRLFAALHERAIIPDQDGNLRTRRAISYPPLPLTPARGMEMAPFERWGAYPGRPRDWLHHKALTRTSRMATVERLFHPDGEPPRWSRGAPRATIAQWLEALVKNARTDDVVGASMSAIQTAEAIPSDRRSDADLGEIVLTADGGLRPPDPDHLFLPYDSPTGGSTMNPASCVHPALVSDGETLLALKELGLRPPSPASLFREAAKRMLGGRGDLIVGHDLYESFWIASRKLSTAEAFAIIEEHNDWPRGVRVRSMAGDWWPLHAVLMPGAIVPGDGSRDDGATVDTAFHGSDDELLRALSVTDTPLDGHDLSWEPGCTRYEDECEYEYRLKDLPRQPWKGYLAFTCATGAGPLEVLAVLSDEGRALYTDALLNLDVCYARWEMWHTGGNRETYPKMDCESLMVHVLREYGRVRTPNGVAPLAHALGPDPESPAALHALLQHPQANRIMAAFDLSEPIPEFFGEGDPIPLTDVWPGLAEYLPPHRRASRLVPCERIRVAARERTCVVHAADVYLVGSVDEDDPNDLRLVARELRLELSHREIEEILHRRTPAEIEARRADVRRCSSDAERLLASVSEADLRTGLPPSLLDVLHSSGEGLTETGVAEAAIATYHSDALRQFRWALDTLDPPATWSGSRRAVAFVRSLGFSEEWAGERKRRRRPFVEAEGPWSLPPLHDYQQVVAANLRNMLRVARVEGAGRRGMLSLPTGSGKTRVVVQAIVEAMRDDGFRGGVLWVADRDELCEQAVEAWTQVWRSIGAQAQRLRISRMWGGQDRPQPTSELHVVVATIQTLGSKLSNRPAGYEFLKDSKLVVFDEAHRSIAPTFTSVMQEIGLTHRRRADEPFLLGLTATPYRGHDAAETARLVRRYGSNRLDSGAFASDDAQDVIGDLQGMGVLAQADHETIDGGTFSLHPDEWGRDEWTHISEQLRQKLPWLPRSVEDRIAQSSERTRRIIEAYETHIEPDWPALIFATSVEHAQTVAALLNRKGIKSRAVSGTTEPATRRRVVEQFRNGEIKALVNYGVFSEGFDAPKTRAIIVARPVYSPNLYFQMIGRGLRGPKNGGDDRCLVLNVRDNIENFDRALAFSDLDWLWTR